MYTTLNYVPIVIGFFIVIYIYFRRQDGHERLLPFLMTILGVGIISSLMRVEMFIKATINAGDDIPVEIFISAMRVIWFPTLIAFAMCFVIIGVAKYKNKHWVKDENVNN